MMSFITFDHTASESSEYERDPSSELLSVLPGQEYSVQDKILRLTLSKSVALQLWVDAMPGCGGIVWPAGQILASYLIKRGSNSLAGKNVVELGSGTGLVGLVAAQLGPEHVWITDQAPLLDIMEKNILMNNISSRCTAIELSWGSSIPTAVLHPDVILAADCVYFEPAFPLLVQTLTELSDSNTEILFCYKKRRKADRRFFSLLKKKFSWEQVMDDPNREIYIRESIYLLRLRKL